MLPTVPLTARGASGVCCATVTTLAIDKQTQVQRTMDTANCLTWSADSRTTLRKRAVNKHPAFDFRQSFDHYVVSGANAVVHGRTVVALCAFPTSWSESPLPE